MVLRLRIQLLMTTKHSWEFRYRAMSVSDRYGAERSIRSMSGKTRELSSRMASRSG